MWVGPAILLLILLVEVIYVLASGASQAPASGIVSPKSVAIVLFGPYVLGVELASMLLLAGLVGAYHLGRRAGKIGG
jgi:NADH-quinone oxidoreductase subunit J